VDAFGVIIFAVFVGLFLLTIFMIAAATINHRRRIRNLPPVLAPTQAAVYTINPETVTTFNNQVVFFDMVND
jgi:biopolymer transport protein ExbD